MKVFNVYEMSNQKNLKSIPANQAWKKLCIKKHQNDKKAPNNELLLVPKRRVNMNNTDLDMKANN